MTEQETNYFLDGVTVKQDLIESIEGLRSELRTAMQPMMEPVYKDNTEIWRNANAHLMCVEGENPIVISLGHLVVFEAINNDAKGNNFEDQDNCVRGQFRFQLADLASLSGYSLTSIKRHIHKLFEQEVIYRCPKKHGWYICNVA